MNTYVKYCPNVFLAKCTEKHERGDVIQVTNKYGQEKAHIIHNLILEKDGFFYYSITREDGYNAQERARRKAEKYGQWAESAEAKSSDFYNRSNKDADFLSLGEPIKVGHHSEGRHRKIIEQAHTNMSKSVEMSKKAEAHEDKAAYWKARENDINLSMPESLDFFIHKLEKAEALRDEYKTGKRPLLHSYSLIYATKDVKELQKKIEIARKLWAE